MSLVRKSSNCSRPGELLARLPCGHTFHKEFGAEQWSGNGRETSCSCVFIPKVCNRYVPISQVDCPNFKFLISRLQGMQVKLTKVFIPQSKKVWFLKKNTENHSLGFRQNLQNTFVLPMVLMVICSLQMLRPRCVSQWLRQRWPRSFPYWVWLPEQASNGRIGGFLKWVPKSSIYR